MAKGEFLGKGVVTLVGVREFTGKQRQAVFLTEYDEDTDTYVGIAYLQSTFFQEYLQNEGKGQFKNLGPKATGAVAVRVPGLRHYPYEVEPNNAFQFVLPNEDTAPLLAIAQANKDAFQSGRPIGSESDEEEPLWKKLGYKSEEKWIRLGRPEK